MTASQRGALIAGLRPEAVARVIELLREQAAQMAAGERAYDDDPLSFAWLSCLEAAASVGRAIAVAHGPGPGASAGSDPADDELQEAWAAARGAATSVRLSLFRRHDTA